MIYSSTALAVPMTDPYRDATRLLSEGQPDAAYEALLTLEQQHASDPEYNYLLGVASLQSGHFSQARNAFERTLLLEPDNAGAYLDLAITNIELKNYDEALRLLTTVEERFQPTRSISRLIAMYRKRVANENKARSVVAGNLFAGAGHSSNVNNGTDKTLIDLDLGDGPVSLPVGDSSKSSPDSFYETGASLNYSLTRGKWRTQLLSSVQRRDYEALTEFDTVNVFTGITSQYSYGRNQYEGGLFYSMVWLDSEDYQSATSASLTWSHRRPSGLHLSSQLRLNQARYLQTPANNLDHTEVILSASQPLSLLGNSSLFHVSLRAGLGDATNNRAGGDQHRWRFSTALISQLTSKQLLRLNLFIGQDMDKLAYNEALFGQQVRETDKMGIDVSYSYFFTPALSTTLSGSLAENRSTIDLFTTDTADISLRLNYSF